MPIVMSVLLAVGSLVRSRTALHLEILALRHQLQVLERSRRPRVRLTAIDRLLWVWFSHIWTEWRAALVLVKPDTVVAWHRRGLRLFWTWKSRRRTGRPSVAADVRALIRCTPQKVNPCARCGAQPKPTAFTRYHRRT
jgi:putative transposase